MTAPPTRPHRRGLLWVVLIALGVIALDQLAKWWAVQTLEGKPPVQVVGQLLQLTFARNPGGAFSIGTAYTWLFTSVAIAVVCTILYFSRRVQSAWWLLALGLITGGAIGNLVDRVSQPPGVGTGHVIDFIQLPNWPIFNVADMSVVCGACLVVALSLFGVEPRPSQDDTPSDSAAASEVGIGQ